MSEKNRVYLETRYRCMGYRLWSPCQSIFGDRHLQRLSTKMTFFNRFQHPLAQPTVEKEKAVTIVIDLDAMTGKKNFERVYVGHWIQWCHQLLHPHQPWFVGHNPGVECFPKLGYYSFVDMPSVRVNLKVWASTWMTDQVLYLELCHVPVLNLQVGRVIRPSDVDSFHYEHS